MSGKTGSQTVAQSLRATFPTARIERHHFLSPETITELRETCALPDADLENAASVLSQCDRAEAFSDADQVISAYRDPMTQSVSAMFQNLAVFNVATVDDALDAFRYVFENREALRRSHRYLDRRRARPVTGFADWFERDFIPVHGVNIYAHHPDRYGTIRFGKFTVYRFESLEDHFAEIFPGLERIDANRSDTKPYASLYREFLTRFVPTAEMLSHYYANRFARTFYPPFTSERMIALPLG
jgi:hypothetical protein